MDGRTHTLTHEFSQHFADSIMSCMCEENVCYVNVYNNVKTETRVLLSRQ